MTLEKKLAMTHLQQSDEELRQSVLDKVEEAETKALDKKDPRSEKVYTFPFSYTDSAGRTFSGNFTNKILTIADKMNVSALESQFNGGQPYDSIEPLQQVVNRGIAWMTFSLTSRSNQKPKSWADNLRSLDDEDLILALFAEVSAHEGTFHGRQKTQEGSEESTWDADTST